MGINIRRYINNIHRAIPDSPARRKRRLGGKRWNIQLRGRKRRERLEDERVGTLIIVVSLVLVAWVMALMLVR